MKDNKLVNFFTKRKIKGGLVKLTPLERDVLKYIHENGPCTEEDIKKHFVGKRKDIGGDYR